MRRMVFYLTMVGAILLSATNANATVLFDFEDAPYGGGAAAIEAYMESVYGSDITVIHGIVGDGIAHGPLGPDHYIQAGPSCGTHWFSFSFNDVPITKVSFDWAVEFDDFHAYADGVEIFTEGWQGWASGNTGIIDLVAETGYPVTMLKFTNSDVGEIEVDNLFVVPEPTTIALLGLGGLLLRRKRA